MLLSYELLNVSQVKVDIIQIWLDRRQIDSYHLWEH